MKKIIKNNCYCERIAFTLAEVLITLTIIGVIAALTIPNLMQKWEEQHTISAVKEAYSILDNGLKQIIHEHGYITMPYNNAEANSNYLLEQLQKYIKFQKICYSQSGCTPKGLSTYKTITGISGKYGTWTESNRYGKAILANGMMINILFVNMDIAPYIMVDVNGAKGPNRWGYDVFTFLFDVNKGLTWRPFYHYQDRCNKDMNVQNHGVSCAYWILLKNNMDYKYRDVSAEW